jgi:hypothetical protein
VSIETLKKYMTKTNCLHEWNKSAVLSALDGGQPERYYRSRCGAQAILTDSGFNVADGFEFFKSP